MSGRTIGIISPPWLTESGSAESVTVDIEGEGAALRLAGAAGMTVEDADAYLEFLATHRAEYEATVALGGVGHA
jgi:hypothetical protein